MNKKRILVIGSNSFSGSHFVNHALTEGAQVWGISRSKQPNKAFLPYEWQDKEEKIKDFHFKQVDLNDENSELSGIIEESNPQIVVNFASQGMVAQSWENPTHWYKTNVLSQVKLHEYLRKANNMEKYVHISTPEVYGSTGRNWINEGIVYKPSTPYATSRAACDMHLMNYYEAYNFPVVFTRAANVYGEGQQLYRIIPRTILSCLCNKKMELHGGGESERSFIHISDVVNATMQIAEEAQPGTIWHISTKETLKIKELVGKIGEMMGKNIEDIAEIVPERMGKDKSYLLSSDQLRGTGWEDKINIEEGIRKTIEWVLENKETLVNMNWDYIHKE